MTGSRTATVSRATTETDITVSVDLDGSGRVDVATGIGFLDHMLTAFGRHAMLDLHIRAQGDLHIDCHHTTEDTGIVLGEAIARAVGDKRGIRRFGHAVVPMDEALVDAALDLSNRPFIAWDPVFTRNKIGDMDTELFAEFFRALAVHARMTLHVRQLAGSNNHHIAEACFKACGRALREAVEPDARAAGAVPSTKGVL